MVKGVLTACAAALAAFALGYWVGIGRSTNDDPPIRSAAPDAATSAPGRAEDLNSGRHPRRRAAPETRDDTPTAVVVDDPLRPVGRLRTGRVTLESLSKYKDYDRATFSFELGARGEVARQELHGNVEISYSGDLFGVRLLVGDASTIADLGAFVSLDALAQSAEPPVGSPLAQASVVEGHAYLVHTVRFPSDHISVLRVVELVPNDRVTFDWADWTSPPRPDRGAGALSSATRTNLAALLDGARVREQAACRSKVGDIKNPADVLLQLRTGAQGGNTSTVTLGDPSLWGGVESSDHELDFAASPTMRRHAEGYMRGGLIPENQAYVIESADVFATAAGDSNGHGEVVVRLASDTLVSLRDEPGPVLDWFEGRIVLRPGDEHRVVVQAANSSSVEVRLRGRFVPLADADTIEAVPFWAQPAPAGTQRAAGGPSGARNSCLAGPHAVLQVQAAHGGGNPMRVSLLGKASIYLRQMSSTPLVSDITSESNSGDSIGYVQGGRIPRGKAFVITRADFEGKTKEGHGSFVVSVMGTTIASIPRQAHDDSISRTWTGRIVVPAGSEGQVFVETSWYSYGSVTLTGEFIDAGTQGR